MKLLLDENLPPRLADVLQSEFSGSVHAHSCGLGSADDEAIWEYARREGFTIVSKDSDFQERSANFQGANIPTGQVTFLDGSASMGCPYR